jgi:peptide/nickel transport system ATP-binding protein
MNSLNPVMRVGDQIADALVDHGVQASRKEFADRIGQLFERVGLQRADANRFPHELSGGMKQRVCIALAISLRPKVIVADEPTSALDVVVQRQVMDTLADVQTDLGAAVILIGHDMGLMAQFVDRLGVMYAGELVEISPMEAVYEEPLHPYTRLLIACLPSLEQKGVFAGIPGLPPSLLSPPPGCPFHPRCPYVMERCRVERPLLQPIQSDRWVACHLYGGDGAVRSG